VQSEEGTATNVVGFVKHTVQQGSLKAHSWVKHAVVSFRLTEQIPFYHSNFVAKQKT